MPTESEYRAAASTARGWARKTADASAAAALGTLALAAEIAGATIGARASGRSGEAARLFAAGERPDAYQERRAPDFGGASDRREDGSEECCPFAGLGLCRDCGHQDRPWTATDGRGYVCLTRWITRAGR